MIVESLGERLVPHELPPHRYFGACKTNRNLSTPIFTPNSDLRKVQLPCRALPPPVLPQIRRTPVSFGGGAPPKRARQFTCRLAPFQSHGQHPQYRSPPGCSRIELLYTPAIPNTWFVQYHILPVQDVDCHLTRSPISF